MIACVTYNFKRFFRVAHTLKINMECVDVNFLACSMGSSDESLRVKGMKELQKFLQKEPEMDRIDVMKIWKGLFYHLWHCDQPKKQVIYIFIECTII